MDRSGKDLRTGNLRRKFSLKKRKKKIVRRMESARKTFKVARKTR